MRWRSSPRASPRSRPAQRTSPSRATHHQGLASVGEGLRVSARAAGDGTVEAIEDAQRRFMLGVLWHPEEDEADRLIGAFVEECRAPAGVGARAAR